MVGVISVPVQPKLDQICLIRANDERAVENRVIGETRRKTRFHEVLLLYCTLELHVQRSFDFCVGKVLNL